MGDEVLAEDVLVDAEHRPSFRARVLNGDETEPRRGAGDVDGVVRLHLRERVVRPARETDRVERMSGDDEGATVGEEARLLRGVVNPVGHDGVPTGAGRDEEPFTVGVDSTTSWVCVSIGDADSPSRKGGRSLMISGSTSMCSALSDASTL